jgi:hypothetical protein
MVDMLTYERHVAICVHRFIPASGMIENIDRGHVAPSVFVINSSHLR